jgi:hypothetical protein
MEGDMQKRTVETALGKADAFLADLIVPTFKMNLDQEPSLDFSNLMDADRKALEEFLSVYGGYKAYLECQVADVEAKKTALESYFDEGYSKAIYRVNDEREGEGRKKLTKEEVRGAVLDRYEELWELRQTLIEYETIHTKVKGLLIAYTSAFNAVSRVVALRTSPINAYG